MRLTDIFLTEQAGTVAIIFGRFNPPHKGHRAAWQMASEYDFWYVGTNRSTQGPKDPLPFDVKIQAMAAVWPEVSDHVVAEQSWLTLAAKAYDAHGAINLLCCTDEDWVTQTINQHNGVKGAHGMYQFASILQKPTPRLSSATALRAAVRAGDREGFADVAGVPAATPVAGHSFFDVVNYYLSQYPEKIKESEPKQLKDVKFAEMSGVIATSRQARDPRYSMSLTKDVRPGEVERNLKKLKLR
jgi:hypothetical protein